MGKKVENNLNNDQTMIKIAELLRCALFIGVIICLIVNLTVKSPVIKFHKKWTSNEHAWQTTKHGDLAAFSIFIRENIFINNYEEYKLIIENSERYDKSEFLGKFWKPIPSIYLFPLNIEVSEDHKASLEVEDFQKLKRLSLLEKNYRSGFLHQKRNYYLVKDINYSDFKSWAVYVFREDDIGHIFVLPLDFKFARQGQFCNE